MASPFLQAISPGDERLAWTLCIVGGALGGSYPVFIKVPRVINAKVSPIIFQCYKSFWVFALSWIFLLVNYLRYKPLLTFTYWGIVGASLWVPAGFAYIAAVPMCGVATATVLNTGVNSVIQFMVSIGTDQTMVRYGSAAVPLAPFYLGALIIGMVGLVFSPTLELRCFAAHVKGNPDLCPSTTSSIGLGEHSLVEKPGQAPTRSEFVSGVLLAMVSGLFGGLKFAVSPIGHQVEERKPGMDAAKVKSLFNVFESYMMCFGIGCAVSTIAFYILFAVLQRSRGKSLPSAEFPVMKTYGFLAGGLWFGYYMCLQGANEIGGGGSFGPAGNASQLITAGLWGLLYYREVRDPRRVMCWVLSAAWTITFVVLLAGSVQKDDGEPTV